MQKDKVRIYILARELNMESKDLLDLCKAHGIDVKNQLSSVEPELKDEIVAMVKRGSAGSAKPTALPPIPTVTGKPPSLPAKPPVLPTPGHRPLPREPEPQPAKTTSPAGPATGAGTGAHPPETLKTTVTAATLSPSAKPAEIPTTRPVEPTPASRAPEPPVTAKAVEPTAPRTPEKPAEPPAAAKAPAEPPAASQRPAEAVPPAPATPSTGKTEPPAPPRQPEQPQRRPEQAPPPRPPLHGGSPGGARVRDLGGSGGKQPQQTGGGPRAGGPGVPAGQGGQGGGDRSRHRTPRPGGFSGVAPAPTPPSSLHRPRQEAKKQDKPAGPTKIMDIPTDVTGHAAVSEFIRDRQQTPAKPGGAVPSLPDVPEEDDEEGGKKKPGVKRKPGEVAGRDARRVERNERQQKRKAVGSVDEVALRRGQVALLDEEDQPKLKKLHRKKKPLPTEKRKGKVPIELPITVRSLSEAMGVRINELLGKLLTQGVANLNINSILDPELAVLLASENGCELEIKRPPDAEERLLARLKEPDQPEDLQPRAPIVTIMGHVDHGKTSLLDKIRQSNVVATEAGGITQVIRAWRVEHDGQPITFLDTPGHEAFTKMRARGANVTDIAVIVVAADDGVMPQTEEAIAHAKAAEVAIVVAINKVDLPNANLRKTEQQLYGLGLIPDNMGGDVPFVQTSAVTGKGIDNLLANLLAVAEVMELKANPNKPASGTCLEANLSEGEGVLATLLVRDGTLHRGDVILCGASYGRVRAMYDDLGRPIQQAGPTVPVRITGLDFVPNADDPFVLVDDLAVAREIAEKRRGRLAEAAQSRRGLVTSEGLLGSLKEQKVTELKVILKAEARGSIEAIRKELEKLHHEEVRVRLLYTAVGGITESDVQLALTSPSDSLILGFNVVPDEKARALAEEKGIEIRQYNIIYNLTDDIRSALEGKLKPREEVVHLGRALVREIFKISRVGTIAGCYVTQGVIERSAKIRLIRAGVVVYPPPERTASLESLKRFKEDVREVREGFECGMKIAGYDDVKVDDVIEAYRIEQVQRTLSSD